MKKHDIVIIGAGNVGWHLAHQFKRAGHRILQVISNSEASAEFLAEEVDAAFSDDLREINRNGSLYLIAVNDDAVEEISEQLHFPHAIILHTCAMLPMEVLEPVSDKFGVFYPLQTMTKSHELNFREVPVFIEASSDDVGDQIYHLAAGITDRVLHADLKKRQALHMAAVFANNFPNHLFYISSQLLKRSGMSFDLLMPLIKETVRKVELHQPYDVQTGPAKRGDMRTVEEHLELLQDFPCFREIYLVMTESLIDAYKK
ncbi:MAG TPA: DUF2520 domain-containing protein [Chitinophagales bacterium]|nr:DUF2520 domain-containing protein [Chitinophagales bacterium]